MKIGKKIATKKEREKKENALMEPFHYDTETKNEYLFVHIKTDGELKSLEQTILNLKSTNKNLIDELLVLGYLFEQKSLKTRNVSSQVITNKFAWSKSHTSRLLRSLIKESFVIKLKCCPYCGIDYKRIPEKCVNPKCSRVLVSCYNTPVKGKCLPFYFVEINNRGEKYLFEQLDRTEKFFAQYQTELKTIRKKTESKRGY